MSEEVLAGGVANEGAVRRVGEHVRRQSNPYSSTIQRLLPWAAGFDGALVPIRIGRAALRRQRLARVAGEYIIEQW